MHCVLVGYVKVVPKKALLTRLPRVTEAVIEHLQEVSHSQHSLSAWCAGLLPAAVGYP